MNAIDRFMDKVVVADNGCWEWQSANDGKGYGTFKFEGKDWKAHRWSYKHHVGEIPDGMCVCHKCDNSICVNPDCLFIGTQQDNMNDRSVKGRQAVLAGTKNGKAILNDHDVHLIKLFLKRHPAQVGGHGGQNVFLARWFGVKSNTVGNINIGRTWRHIT